MAITKPARTLTTIDQNLKLICDARAKAAANRASALKNSESAERMALTCEYQIIACDERITELLDERLRSL